MSYNILSCLSASLVLVQVVGLLGFSLAALVWEIELCNLIKLTEGKLSMIFMDNVHHLNQDGMYAQQDLHNKGTLFT